FMSRPIDISKYTLIYAGAQKNIGPAGTVVVIVKKDALGKVSRPLPTMMNYQTHIDKGSMFNTPPVYAVYTVLQTLKWLEKSGGIESIEKINIEKANMLYDEIERNKLFVPTVEKDSRSRMNVCFIMNDTYKDLEKEFMDFATKHDIVGIKGHRSVGGFRASIYNALPKSSVEHLISVMQEFEQKI
ncbi:MAG TPA: 3-phosphoserine/phosphohydroxythreonine transaminase, partial [Bacteroidales bacterium]|nr:3-phosphoserine/phosphohydroxythreonine transaminase [Bacteroidales bacterium]